MSDGRANDAQRWVMGVHAFLLQRNKMDLDRLGGMERPGYSFVSARMMAQQWGIFTSEEARDRIDWLIETGHRGELGSEAETHLLAGFDWIRAAGVAAWSWHCYLLELDDAWARMVSVAEKVQRTYRSWGDLAASYVRGYERMFGRDAELELLSDGVLPALLALEGGPWSLPFELDLGAARRPPAIEQGERVVDPSDPSAYPTLGDALRAAEAGDRVVVKAGTYRERVNIVTPVEIVGEGEVSIEHDEGCCLFVKASSGMVRNLRFRSGVSAAGEAMHAVIVHGHFLRMVDCEIRSARSGIFVTNDKACASVVDTRIEGAAAAGVLVQGGRLSMERSSVSESGLANVQVSGESEAHFTDCTFERAKDTGLSFIEGAVGVATRCKSLWNLAGVDVTTGARLEITGGAVESNGGGGVRIFGEGSALEASEVRIADNGAVNVGANQATRIVFQGCELSGGGLGVWADHGARIRLEGCRVGRGSEGLVREMNDGKVDLVGCVADDQADA